MGTHRLHDLLKDELNKLAVIARRLHPLAILLEVAATEGYSDLFEALQNTPEEPSGDGKHEEPEEPAA